MHLSDRPVTRNFSGSFENPSERNSEEHCEGNDLYVHAFGARKTVSDSYFEQRLLQYDFQIARGKTVHLEPKKQFLIHILSKDY